MMGSPSACLDRCQSLLLGLTRTLCAFRLRPRLDLASYPAGYYHHDRCGHRLKAYIFLNDVGEREHPLRVALGSHRTLYYSHNDMPASRFTDAFVERNYAVVSVVGEMGDGFVFDTNAIHKAGGAGLVGAAAHGQRDVLLFEFNSRNKSKMLREIDPGIPCGQTAQLL